ncbi:hypothetical protein [Streptomyces albus]|uniref:hypothetical protein n=1 Tax=Streptomyces albus TaxID=1888 RepID=UPI0034114591
MDEGVAAVVAGLAGFAGAIAGGMAAIRGARIGAETSARALRQQVQDQADSEHARWLREQRRQGYNNYITAAQKVAAAAREAVLEPTDATTDELFDATIDLTHLRSAVTLIGPEAIESAADDVLSSAHHLDHVLREAAGRFGVPDEEQMEPSRQAYQVFSERYDHFVLAARAQLGAT